MSGITPGGWGRNIPPASRYPVIFAGRNTHVAQVLSRGLPPEQVEANANLIAAAPDLLALAERVAGLNRDAGEVAQLIDQARAVVARIIPPAPDAPARPAPP